MVRESLIYPSDLSECLWCLSVRPPVCLSVCLSVSVRLVCLCGLLFHCSLCNKLRLTLQREVCAGSICFLAASLILEVLGT